MSAMDVLLLALLALYGQGRIYCPQVASGTIPAKVQAADKPSTWICNRCARRRRIMLDAAGWPLYMKALVALANDDRRG